MFGGGVVWAMLNPEASIVSVARGCLGQHTVLCPQTSPRVSTQSV
jgi:hypothetical protein